MNEQNRELKHAWDFVEHTGISIFLTGKAGTGKTTFLKTLKEYSTKRMVVVAPTGVAAINAGGMTIHSFFQLPLSPFIPGTNMKRHFNFSKEKRKIIASLDLLIIDEISMVRSDLLDAVDSVLRRYRNRYQPFGGVQLLMIGDLQQLTPVVTQEESELLNQHYATPYFFSSKALAQTKYVTIQLEKVYRQQDEKFVGILNHIRDGHPSIQDLELLNSRYDAHFSPSPNEGFIRLTTHNYIANNHNESELNKLPTKAFIYDAEISGTFPEYAYPTDQSLILKQGAQVMFVKNDASSEHRYYNGRIGKITWLDENEVRVRCEGDTYDIIVAPQEWENAKYHINDETKELETEIVGLFRQLPLRLAWAITIHKSQGLTFDHAIIDAGMSFAPGQVYVALSRCKTLEGMVLGSPLERRSVINDERVTSYILHQDQEAQESINQLPTLKEEYYRQLLLELFDFKALYYKEEYLSHLLSEFFSNSFQSLTQLHKQVVISMKKEVIDVADKWNVVIRSSQMMTLKKQEFQDRITRSCNYFITTLHKHCDQAIDLCKSVKTNNQEAMRRLSDTWNEMRLLFDSHLMLLKAIESKGFSVNTYLKEKQNSFLSAMDGDQRKDERTVKTTEKQKKVNKKTKEEKEKTWMTSYRLYCEGMKADEIAIHRGLTISTIFGHLARFIKSGEIALTDIIDEQKIEIIKKAIALKGQEGKNAVKSLCPPDISYAEISIVMDI